MKCLWSPCLLLGSLIKVCAVVLSGQCLADWMFHVMVMESPHLEHPLYSIYGFDSCMQSTAHDLDLPRFLPILRGHLNV